MTNIENILKTIARYGLQYYATWDKECRFYIRAGLDPLTDGYSRAPITAEDLPLLEQSMQDGSLAFGPELYCSRKLGKRPCREYYEEYLSSVDGKVVDQRLRDWFDACEK